MPFYPEVQRYRNEIRKRNAELHKRELEQQRQHGGKNYTPPVREPGTGRCTLAGSVECDCGSLVILHDSWTDMGRNRLARTTDCTDCGQHWTTPWFGPGAVGGFRAECAGANECPCGGADNG